MAGLKENLPWGSFRNGTQEGSVEIDYERLPKAWGYMSCPVAIWILGGILKKKNWSLLV